MTSLIKALLKIIICLALIYLFIFTFYRTGDNRVGVLKDAVTGDVAGIFTEKYNFVWQGALPWKYAIEVVDTNTSAIINARILLPELTRLEDDSYGIRVPFSITYRIDGKNPPDKKYFKSGEALNSYVNEFINAICASVMADYLTPVYKRDIIVKEEKEIYGRMAESLVEKLKDAGIICDRIEVISRGYFPDERLYSEALSYCKELRQLDFSTIKNDITMKKRLIEERRSYNAYLEQLHSISSLIKENPDILKYIYIDKMGGNIKVIISSDKTGLPYMIGSPVDDRNTELKGDIDNFRR